jgi:lipopolysaccharide export system permease protein
MYKIFFRRFTAPWISTLVIAVFILVFRSVEVWLKDLADSGSAAIILEVMGWASLMLLPGALAIASMAAAIMTVGSLKEYREISALHAAGVSPARIARPAFLAAVILFGLGILATQYIAPKAYFKMTETLWEAKTAEGVIQIKSGQFIQALDGVTFYASSERPESNELEDLIIYDRENSIASLPVVIAAERGLFKLSSSRLQLRLFNGSRHVPDSASTYSRTYFDSLMVSFPLPEARVSPSVPSQHRYFASNRTLHHQLDSLNNKLEIRLRTAPDIPKVTEKYHKDLAKVRYELARRWASLPMYCCLCCWAGLWE